MFFSAAQHTCRIVKLDCQNSFILINIISHLLYLVVNMREVLKKHSNKMADEVVVVETPLFYLNINGVEIVGLY